MQRTGGHSDEEVDARCQRFEEPREGLIEFGEETAESNDVFAKVFVLHRNDDPIRNASSQSGDEGASLASISPVLPSRRYAGSRDHAEPLTFWKDACQSLVDASLRRLRRCKVDRRSKRLREVERCEPLRANEHSS